MKKIIVLISVALIFIGCSSFSPAEPTQEEAFEECINRCEYFICRLWENENVFHTPINGITTSKYPTTPDELRNTCILTCSQPE